MTIAVIMKLKIHPDMRENIVAQLDADRKTGNITINLVPRKPGDLNFSPRWQFPSDYPTIFSIPSNLPKPIFGAKTPKTIDFIKNALAINPWLWSVVALIGYVFCMTFFFMPIWLFLFWKRPLFLFKLNEKLGRRTIGIKIFVDFKISLAHFLWLTPFHYRNRTLDALVEKALTTARKKFTALETVAAREIHLETPITINGENIAQPSFKDFQAIWAKKRFCLIIWGEGGSGKTSLACYLARMSMADNPELRLSQHSMIPILIEYDLNLKVETDRHPLLEAIRKQLELMTGIEEIPPSLLYHMLRKQRILVIIDHFSELSKETQALIEPGVDPKMVINAMIVTSRLDE
jgi:hypothetical protein